MLVSQTSARSSLNSAALSLTKPNRWLEPHSSSPSIIMVMGSGNWPVTATNARQASTKGGTRQNGGVGPAKVSTLPLLVAFPARDDDLAAVREGRNAGRERRGVPQIE